MKIPNNLIIHTPTLEEAKELLKFLDSKGYKWKDGTSLLMEDYYEIHKQFTSYIIEDKSIIHSCIKYLLLLPETTFKQFKERYMEKEYNFAELLKGHEGETFYSTICGDIIFIGIEEKTKYPLEFKSLNNISFAFTKEGKHDAYKPGELIIFPSKDQRNWDKWIKESTIPKTWSQYYTEEQSEGYKQQFWYNQEYINEKERSAAALCKILKLIEVGYGGLVSKKEIYNEYKEIIYYINGFSIRTGYNIINNLITFHTKEQAEEFLSYEENVQLLKEYYMI